MNRKDFLKISGLGIAATTVLPNTLVRKDNGRIIDYSRAGGSEPGMIVEDWEGGEFRIGYVRNKEGDYRLLSNLGTGEYYTLPDKKLFVLGSPAKANNEW